MNSNISNINRKTLLLHPEKYIWMEVSEEYNNTNFSLLLHFIDECSDCGENHIFENGNAYSKIKKKTNSLLGIGIGSPCYIRTSKKEIKSILHTIPNKVGTRLYIKIPYKVSYIFKAILLIIDEIKDKKINFPQELQNTYNLTYRIAYYSYHIQTYDSFYEYFRRMNIETVGYNLKCELHNDFYSENSVFGTAIER